MKPITRVLICLIAFSCILQFSVFAIFSSSQDTAAGVVGGSGDMFIQGLSGPGETGIMQASGDSLNEDIVTISSVLLLYRNGNEIGDDTVRLNEEIMIRFDFTVSQQASDGDAVTLTIPDEILFSVAGNVSPIAVPLVDGAGNPTDEILAYVALYPDVQKIEIVFTELIDQLDQVEHAYFEFYGRFDSSQLGQGGKKTITFEANGKSIGVEVHFGLVNLDLKKELDSQYLEDGVYYQVWKVVVNSSRAELYDLEIRDVLPNGLRLKGYRLEGVGSDRFVVAQPENGIVLTAKEMIGDTVTLYLTTYVSDLQAFHMDQEGQFPIVNEASASANGGGMVLPQVSDRDTVYISADWIKKTGATVEENGSITWTVRINPDKIEMKETTVTDTIPKGLLMEEGSIKVKTEDGGAALSAGISSVVGDNGAVIYTLRLGDISECYLITYTTTLTEKVDYNQALTFTNGATIAWGLENGGSCFTPPGVRSEVKVTNSLLAKTGVWYYPKRQCIEWAITVNGSKNPIVEKITVTDTLNIPGQQQTLSEDTVRVVLGDRSGGRQTLLAEEYDFQNNGDGTFHIVFPAGMLYEKTAYITFMTTLDDLQFLAQNGPVSRKYQNDATLVIGENGARVKATGYQSITTSILEKNMAAYDHSRQTFTWKIVVNPNGLTGLGKTVVTDTLPADVVLESFEIYAGDIVLTKSGYDDTMVQGAELAQSEYGYMCDGEKMTFTFEDGALDGRAAIIVVHTRIADSFFEKNRASTEFINQAKITMEHVTNDPAPVTATGDVKSTLVSKTGRFNKDEGAIAWNVVVNANGLGWNLEGCTLTDYLQQGLVLDYETIKLTQYGVNPTLGTPVHMQEIPLDLNNCVYYNLATNLFEFTFPAVEAGYTYLLHFSTDVEESGNYSNTIHFSGISGDGESSQTSVSVDLSGASAGAVGSRKGKISLKKVDPLNGTPLEGAVFELRNEEGTVLETETTNNEGRISFGYWLRYETNYYLYEIQAPEGYVAAGKAIPVRMEKGVEETMTYLVPNERIYGGIEILKTLEDGNALEDVAFTLYDSDHNLVAGLANPGVSDAEGKIVFAPLQYGAYLLVETKAPDHVVLDDTPIAVDIQENGKVITLEVVNRLVTDPGDGGGEEPGDGGIPEEPEDDKKPEESGKPEEPGDSKKPEESGKPEEPGDGKKPEESGKPEGPGDGEESEKGQGGEESKPESSQEEKQETSENSEKEPGRVTDSPSEASSEEGSSREARDSQGFSIWRKRDNTSPRWEFGDAIPGAGTELPEEEAGEPLPIQENSDAVQTGASYLLGAGWIMVIVSGAAAMAVAVSKRKR